ncbi:urease accessory protein UreE [Massilia sp. IC2-278]|uniref:urease accessory protein UreE n=1 Tax=Massilia sp. IC2-278 TaxID=2887200 RepID=UPI001E5C3893|nr:urease accessory protein UreE [Massilia sp. IC2-278]MCC2959904.1 urease accessory protein UreE [Massilia sp. IC2-278]
MLTLHTRIDGPAPVDGELVLPFHLREKSRLRAALKSGEEVAVLRPRGTVLRGGDLLQGEDGRVVRVVAELEAVYRVAHGQENGLLRCAFHLGNRHTQTEVGQGWLRIRADAVLREMLLGLGAQVTEERAAFEPEAGAYGGGHHHGESHPLAPVPLRQKIHRPSDLP